MEAFERAQLAVAQVVALIAERAEPVGCLADHAGSQPVDKLDEQRRAPGLDRAPRAARHAKLVALDVDLDEPDVGKRVLVESLDRDEVAFDL